MLSRTLPRRANRRFSRHSSGTRYSLHRQRAKLLVERLEDRVLLSADPGSWVIATGEDSASYLGVDVEVVGNGDIYLSGTVDVAGERDFFLRKYSTAGVEQWTSRYLNSGRDSVKGMDVDVADINNPFIYLVGTFENELDFGTAGTLQSIGEWDIFVAKLDGGGSPIWAKSFGGSNWESAEDITLHGSSLYLTGNFIGTADFGGTILRSNKPRGGNTDSDAFVLKLDASNGSVTWAEQVGGSGWASGSDIAVYEHSPGNVHVYATGHFGGQAQFGSTSLDSDDGARYIAKLSDTGASANFVWAEQFGGIGPFIGGTQVTVDATGSIFLGGDFRGQAQFGTHTRAAVLSPTDNDGFVTRVTDNGTSGTFEWVNQISGDQGWQQARAIAVENNTLFVTGKSDGTGQFESTGGSTVFLNGRGGGDGFVARYDTNGSLLVAQRMGGSSGDWGGGFGAMTVDTGIMYIAGHFSSSDADFPASAPGATSPDAFTASTVSGEIFQLKLNAAAPIVTISNPTSGSSVDAGTPKTLTAAAIAGDLTTDLSASIVWTSSLDGQIGTGGSITTTLSVGTHEITAYVIDPNNSALIGMEGVVVVVEAPAPPVAADDSYSVQKDKTLTVSAPGVLDNDSDPNGDPLTAVLVSPTSSGTLTLNNDGSFTYTPNTGFTGIDTFTYIANDGTGDSNDATVMIEVKKKGGKGGKGGTPSSSSSVSASLASSTVTQPTLDSADGNSEDEPALSATNSPEPLNVEDGPKQLIVIADTTLTGDVFAPLPNELDPASDELLDLDDDLAIDLATQGIVLN